jgi:hypothetical protein
MEPSGRNQWQPVASAQAQRTAETGQKPLPPVATRPVPRIDEGDWAAPSSSEPMPGPRELGSN